jgi:hypothetical protein
MGLFRRSASEGTGTIDATATAVVVSGDSGVSGTTRWSAVVELEVDLPGTGGTALTYKGMVDREKQLCECFDVPIAIDPGKPRSFAIRWDDVPTVAQRIAARDPAIVDPVATWDRLQQLKGRPPSAHPWGDGTVPGWPEPLTDGRRPGTAWLLNSSMDAQMCDSDGVPPGRARYRCSGPISAGRVTYLTWLLLCVRPEQGEPYGLHVPVEARRGKVNAVLPVAIDPQDPADIVICWDQIA